MRKGMKRCFTLLVAAAMVTGMLSGCGKQEVEKMDNSIHVDTQLASYGSIEVVGQYIGTAAPNEEVSVMPLVSGTVEKVNVKIGDVVKEGDVLCQFDDTAASFSVKNAEGALNSAQAGKNTAKDQAKISKAQTSNSIDTINETIKSYKKAKSTAEQKLNELKKNKSAVEAASSAAQSAYVAAKTKYKTAETLHVNFKSFLNSNADCQTTAGLTLAASMPVDESDAAAVTKKKTAESLVNALNKAGVTVEYVSDSGLTSLKEDLDDAEKAYTAAAGGLGELEGGIATLKESISSLEAQISATQKSLSSAKKSQSLANSVDTDAVYNAQISAAQVGVDAAKYQQDMYTLKAPISGTIESVNVSENAMFAQGYAAFTIASKDAVLVTFYVTEETKNFLTIGDEIEAENGGTTYRGNITSIGAAVDQMKGLFKVEAQIFIHDLPSISTGVSVKLSLVTNKEDNAIVIPYDAVYYDNNQSYVYCVKNGVAVKVDVTTGLYNDSYIAIESGLSEGDEVIITWASGLKDGAPIASEDTITDDDADQTDSAGQLNDAAGEDQTENAGQLSDATGEDQTENAGQLSDAADTDQADSADQSGDQAGAASQDK